MAQANAHAPAQERSVLLQNRIELFNGQLKLLMPNASYVPLHERLFQERNLQTIESLVGQYRDQLQANQPQRETTPPEDPPVQEQERESQAEASQPGPSDGTVPRTVEHNQQDGGESTTMSQIAVSAQQEAVEQNSPSVHQTQHDEEIVKSIQADDLRPVKRVFKFKKETIQTDYREQVRQELAEEDANVTILNTTKSYVAPKAKVQQARRESPRRSFQSPPMSQQERILERSHRFEREDTVIQGLQMNNPESFYRVKKGRKTAQRDIEDELAETSPVRLQQQEDIGDFLPKKKPSPVRAGRRQRRDDPAEESDDGLAQPSQLFRSKRQKRTPAKMDERERQESIIVSGRHREEVPKQPQRYRLADANDSDEELQLPVATPDEVRQVRYNQLRGSPTRAQKYAPPAPVRQWVRNDDNERAIMAFLNK